MTAAEIALRPAGPADAPFLRELFVEARPELSAIALPPRQLADLVDLQVAAQRAQYRAAHPAAEDRVIVSGGQAVGRCWTSTSAGEVRLLDLSVGVLHRRAGVARAVVQLVCERAASAGLPVRLAVWTANDAARRLYADLGFRAEPTPDGPGGYLHLSWFVGAAALRRAS